MNDDVTMLNHIYQNSQMGVGTIEKLMDISKDTHFKSFLKGQYNGYKEIHEKAKDLLNKNGYDEKSLNAFEKIRTSLMINMQTLTDKSSSHIAEMLIIGSNMGVTDAIKNIKKYKKNTNPDIINLMEKLKTFEEENIASLKEFL